ncbi:MAG: hypothetical protein ACO1O6_04235 [Bacteroidota bacterium]
MRNEFAVIITTLIFAAGAIVAYVFYLLTLQRTLQEVSPQNRQVPPSNVWLMCIPVFSMIYPFILYPKISDSIMEEFADRKLDTSGDFSRNIGIALAILTLGAPTLRFLGPLAFLGGLASLGFLVIWIVYWVKMNQFKEQLKNSGNLAGVSLSNNPDLLD